MPSACRSSIPRLLTDAQIQRGFHIHLAVFLLIAPVNWIIWRLTGGGYPWYIWPVAGWGIGVAFHWIGIEIRLSRRESGWQADTDPFEATDR
jgi:hypothetical protein